jgi:hypothetical protein
MEQTQVNPQYFAECSPMGMSCVCAGPKTSGLKQAAQVGTKSRWAQYLEAFPLHANTVELVCNIQTGNMSPQIHLVFDDYFETVHSYKGQEPTIWAELMTF